MRSTIHEEWLKRNFLVYDATEENSKKLAVLYAQLSKEEQDKDKAQINDIVYAEDSIINEVNLYAFDEVYDTRNIDIKDIIKVVNNNKKYYFQRRYG